MPKENYKEESMIKQVLTTEVKFIIGVITIALGVVAPYYGIRQDIALIQSSISNINSNHEAHIQDIQQNIKDLQITVTAQNAEIIDLQKQIISIKR